MEEYIDILNKDGSFTGKCCLKSEIHEKGYYHNTVHIWLFNDKAEILLQQRSFKKSICPGLWDVSAAGHVDAGESLIEAAIREVDEELGLNIKPVDLKFVGYFECFKSYNNNTIVDNEFHNAFICQLNASIEDLQILEEEVEDVKLVSTDNFKELLDQSGNNNHFVPSNKAYYFKILDAIKMELA